MTLFDLMPALWLSLAFLFSCAYFISGSRCFLYGSGGAFFALGSAVLCLHIYVQTVLFFGYMLSVLALSRIVSAKKPKPDGAVALTKIDCDGGYILYKGTVRRAYSRDPFFTYEIGDVLEVTLMSDGTLRADRI